jgi:hypothetical protein
MNPAGELNNPPTNKFIPFNLGYAAGPKKWAVAVFKQINVQPKAVP